MSLSVSLDAGSLTAAIDDRLGDWTAHAFGRRLWDRDVTLWADEPVDELANRLGWLDLPTRSAAITDECMATRTANPASESSTRRIRQA